MNRTSMKISGVIFSILYAFLFVASIVLCFLSVIYEYYHDIIQTVNDLVAPIFQNSFLRSFHGTILIAVCAGIMVAMLILLIISVRFIKYSKASTEKYGKAKGLLFFNFLLLLTAGIATAYLIYKYVNNSYAYKYYILGAVVGIEGILLLCILYALIKYKKPVNTLSNVGSIKSIEMEEKVIMSSPTSSIYTAGLEENKLGILDEETHEAEVVKKPSQNYETETTQKLVEGISKLDQMRKEGSITTQEYTKLRNQMIKKFVK